jgi:DNA-directed RNA polymerase specialized sigma24 family protein
VADDPLAANATALLLACARGDAHAGDQYVELLFPHLRPIVRERPESLLRHAATLIGAPTLTLPQIPQQDREHLAATAAFEGLDRARRNAAVFDPQRGDGFSWALGATALAYLDVVRKEYGTRRQLQELLVDDEQLARLELELPTGPPTDEIVEGRLRLEEALAQLTDLERYVVLAKLHFGLTYTEIAQYRFGEATPTTIKRVDRLLQSARSRLRALEADNRRATGRPDPADGP